MSIKLSLQVVYKNITVIDMDVNLKESFQNFREIYCQPNSYCHIFAKQTSAY